MTITCQVCGTINPDGTTYCEGCGVELATTPAAPAAPAAETTPVVGPATETPAVPVPADPVPSDPVPADPVPSDTMPADTTPPAPEAAVAPGSAIAGEPAPVAEAPAAAPVADVTAPGAPETDAVAPDAGMAAVPAAVPAAPTGGAAKLGIKKFGAPTGEFIPLQGERLTVGRFDASTGPVDIDLTGMSGQEHISRRHAELYLDGGAWHVRDLGSTNGVYLKRRGEATFSPRLQEPAALADGDEIAFGNVMLTFQQA